MERETGERRPVRRSGTALFPLGSLRYVSPCRVRVVPPVSLGYDEVAFFSCRGAVTQRRVASLFRAFFVTGFCPDLKAAWRAERTGGGRCPELRGRRDSRSEEVDSAFLRGFMFYKI